MRRKFVALFGALLLALSIPIVAQAKVTYGASTHPPVASEGGYVKADVQSVTGDVLVSKLVSTKEKTSNYKEPEGAGAQDPDEGSYEGSFDVELATDMSGGSGGTAQAKVNFSFTGALPGRTYTIYCEKKGSIAGDGADMHVSAISKRFGEDGTVDGGNPGCISVTVETSGSYRFSINREPKSTTSTSVEGDGSLWVGSSTKTSGSGLLAYWVEDRRASNYRPEEGDVVVRTFLLKGSLKNFVLAYVNINSVYAGKHAKLYVQHNVLRDDHGVTEVWDGIINSYGTVSYSMDAVTDDALCTLVVKNPTAVKPDDRGNANDGNDTSNNIPRDRPNINVPSGRRSGKSLSDQAYAPDGISLQVYIAQTMRTTGTLDELYWTNTPASNYTPSLYDIPASFVLKGSLRDFEIRVIYDRLFAGRQVLLYVEHDDGTTEVQERTLNENGEATFEMDRLSTYTLVVRNGAPAVRQGVNKVDTCSRSPQTGVGVSSSLPDVPLAASALFVAVAGCAVGVRRKLGVH